MKLCISLALFCGVLGAQAPPAQVVMQVPAPASAYVTASVVGNQGNASYTYYVIGNYTGGTTTSQAALVTNAPQTLSAGNAVNVGWSVLNGVSTYDVVRLLPSQTFTGSCVCAVATSLTVTSYLDIGNALVSYTIGAAAPAVAAVIYPNNTGYSPPELRQIINGVDSPIGGNTVVGVTATLPVTSTGGTTPNIAINKATSTTFGVVEPDNSTITITGGVITAAPPAGVVTSVTGVTPISSTGGATPAISVATATSSVKGVVQTDGNTISNSAGTISCTTTTTSQLGCGKPDGTTITVSSGVESVPTATTGALGIVKPDGTTITVSSGVLSGPTFSTNGTSNSTQGSLNLVSGTNCTVTNTSGSMVSFTCSQTNITGNAATATNLASYPTLCSSQYSAGLSSGSNNCTAFPTFNQNTTGTAANLSGTPTVPNGTAAATQSQNDNSAKLATTAYTDLAVANAVSGINPAVAVQAATTTSANTSGFTYNNGVTGIGATFTGSTNTAIVIDGYTFTALGQRLLVKNDTQSPSGAFNGIYYVTQLQTSLLPPILTRALDYDQPSDMNNTGAIPVVNGTINGTTSWLMTSQVVTVGTTPLVFVQFSYNPTASVTLTTGATATLTTPFTFNQEATAATAITYTLPTASAGAQFCVANSQSSGTPTTGTLELLTSTSGQFIEFTDGTLSATGGYVISGGAANDEACVVGENNTIWKLYTQSGTWTKH